MGFVNFLPTKSNVFFCFLSPIYSFKEMVYFSKILYFLLFVAICCIIKVFSCTLPFINFHRFCIYFFLLMYQNFGHFFLNKIWPRSKYFSILCWHPWMSIQSQLYIVVFFFFKVIFLHIYVLIPWVDWAHSHIYYEILLQLGFYDFIYS